jgi:FKBP-type peptidyl-prolyl cis-trans isomerase FkpA
MSVTTVPIQPIKKGSLTKYWLGIIAVLAIAGALAWLGTSDIRAKYQSNENFLANNADADGVETTKSGLQIQTLAAGEGTSPTDNDVTLIGYKGTLRDGTVFDENAQAPMPVQGVVPGFSEALKKMKRGGKYKIWIPSDLGYGPKDKTDPQSGRVVLPGGSMLIFEVELKDFISREQFEKGMAEMQKKQAAQGGAAGAGTGGPGTAVPQGGPAAPGAQGLPPEIQAQIDAQMQGQGQGQGGAPVQ